MNKFIDNRLKIGYQCK